MATEKVDTLQSAQIKAIEDNVNELKTKLNQFGKVSTKYEKEIVYGKFEGVISHYHCYKGKIDCAGLEIGDLIDEVINED